MGYRVVVAGATGNVGREMVNILAEREFPADEIAYGIHSGGVETALMLALRPDLVRTDRIADFPPRNRAMVRDFTHLRAGRPAAFAWKAGDLHPSGAMGDARLGSASAGRTALDHGAAAFVELLRDVDRFELDGSDRA